MDPRPTPVVRMFPRAVSALSLSFALLACGGDAGTADAGAEPEPEVTGEPAPAPEAEPAPLPEPAPDGADPEPEAEPDPLPAVVVNEVAPTGDPADWIEIANLTAEPIDLSGWVLTDSDPTHVFFFAEGASLAAGGRHVVFRDPDGGGFAFGLGASDAVALADADGTPVDRVEWEDGDVPAGTSWGRIPDLTGDFQALVTPTPGAENVPNPDFECGDGTADLDEVCDGNDLRGLGCEHAGLGDGTLACAPDCQGLEAGTCADLPWDVVLNEVESGGDDRIELFNPGAGEVDLSGWTVTDSNATPKSGAYVFPQGSSVAAGEYLVLVKGTDHAFGLKAEDAVRLYDADQALVDRVAWPDGGAEVSWCRRPDGDGLFGPCESETFGDAN